MKRELSPTERLEIRVEAVEGKVRSLQGRQRQLEEAWQDFVPAVTDGVSKRIIPALIKGLAETMQIPSSLEVKLDDFLSLKDRRG